MELCFCCPSYSALLMTGFVEVHKPHCCLPLVPTERPQSYLDGPKQRFKISPRSLRQVLSTSRLTAFSQSWEKNMCSSRGYFLCLRASISLWQSYNYPKCQKGTIMFMFPIFFCRCEQHLQNKSGHPYVCVEYLQGTFSNIQVFLELHPS